MDDDKLGHEVRMYPQTSLTYWFDIELWCVFSGWAAYETSRRRESKIYFEQIHDKMTLLLAEYFDGDVLDYLSLIALTAITMYHLE